MTRDITPLSEKDYKLLKKDNPSIIGESGPHFPTFGNHLEDYIRFHIYNMNGEYIKSGISEDFDNDGNNIKLKPGNDLRKAGFTRGDYKVRYHFHRRLAGANEVILTKTVGEDSGIVHSSNPQLTGVPMGEFFVEDDGRVFVGTNRPTDGSEPTELDIKEYKFFIDEISADRTEVRLATQVINLQKYKDEFFELSNTTNTYKSVIDVFGTGFGKFQSRSDSRFNINSKEGSDVGFEQKFLGGQVIIEDAFIVGNNVQTDTSENDGWSLEDPIPATYIEAYDLKEAGFPMAVRYVIKDEVSTKTLGGHDFEGYQPIPNLITPGIKYHFDFGCGHTEITDAPFANHTYDTEGTYNPVVTIMTPNFTEVVTDVYKNTGVPQDGPGLRGSKLNGFVPTPEVTAEEEFEAQEEAAPSISALDGKVIKWDGLTHQGTPQKIAGEPAATTTRWYIQNGYRRWVTSSFNMTLLREAMGLEEENDVTLYTMLINTIPVGPNISGTTFTTGTPNLNDEISAADYGTLILPTFESIEDEEEETDDSDSDDSSDDSSEMYTLELSLEGYIDSAVEQLPYSTSSGDDDPGTTLDASWLVNGQPVNSYYSTQTFEAGTSVEVEVVVESFPSEEYQFIEWNQGTIALRYTNPRIFIMNNDKSVTARVGVGF
jgi:hypothetical protein